MKYFKLFTRIVIISFVMGLAYMVTTPSYLAEVQNLKEWTVNLIVGAVFGALTLIIKFHFETKPSDN
jgi:hypothetical protein